VAALTVDHAVDAGVRRFSHQHAGRGVQRGQGVRRGQGPAPVAAPPGPPVDDLAVMLGYWYASSAVAGGRAEPPTLAGLGRTGVAIDGLPGTRVPHVWLRHEGGRCSTVDLCAGRWVLLAGGTGDGWAGAFDEAASERRLAAQGYRLGADIRPADGEPVATAALGLDAGGAMLVRPDGFVGWRSGPADRPSAALLGSALDGLLRRAPLPSGATAPQSSGPTGGGPR
jgi:tetracenomycin A2 monooxygenase-dioxygenase